MLALRVERHTTKEADSNLMLSRCQRCSTVFNRVAGETVCPQCDAEDVKYTRSVEDYLAHNPDSSADAIAKATGVPMGFVSRYLGHASADAGSEHGASICQRCEARAAVSNQLCNRCLIIMRQELVEATKEQEAQESRVSSVGARRAGRGGGFRASRYTYTEKTNGGK